MPRYIIADYATEAEIAFDVDWGMPASRSYPAEMPTVHGIAVTIGGALIDAETEREILTRWTDDCLAARAAGEERDRADDAGDQALNLQREDV